MKDLQIYYLSMILCLATSSLSAQFDTSKVITDFYRTPVDAMSFDIDQNGTLDVVAISQSEKVLGWNRGLGLYDYEKMETLTLDLSYIVDMDTADFDGDGYTDVVVASSFDDKISWVRNNALGGFDTETPIINSGDFFNGVCARDMDGDGDQDIVAITRDDAKVMWFENTGGGVFGTEHIVTTAMTNGTALACDDFDNDGDIDIVAGGFQTGSVDYFENLSSGNFAAAVNITTSAAGLSVIKVADIDQDGWKDIVTTSWTDDEICWHQNLAGTGFSAENVVGVSYNPWQVTAQDDDNDGDTDLIVHDGNGYFRRYENLTGTTFATQTAMLLMHSVKRIETGDPDNDGDQDLLIAASYSVSGRMITWLENTGGGTYGENHRIVPDLYWPQHTVAIEVTGDTLTDLVYICGNPLVYLENLGNGKFERAQLISDQHISLVGLHNADLDNDGDQDIVVASSGDDKLAWYQNLGNGFGPQQIIPSTVLSPQSVFCTDLDNDGWSDVLLASGNDTKISWYKNTGGVIGNEQTIYSGLTDAYAILGMDVDQDGDDDIIAGGGTELLFFENLGAGSFNTPVVMSSAMNFVRCIVEGDLDNDGINDIVLATYNTEEIIWFKNNLTSFAGPFIISDAITIANRLKLADFDDDGDLDITSVSFTNDKVYWHENVANASTFITRELPLYLSTPYSVNVYDFDNDGDLDIYSAGRSEDKVVWYENFLWSNYQARGKVFIDLDSNGVFDGANTGVNNVAINSLPEYDYSYTYTDGSYFVNFDSTSFGSYVIQPDVLSYWTFSTPSSYTVNTTPGFKYVDSLDFGLVPDTNVTYVSASMVATSGQCDSEVPYVVDVFNPGTTIAAGVITATFSDTLSVLGGSPAPDSIVGNTVYWHFDSLYYFDHIQFTANIQTPGFQYIGSTVLNTVTVDATDQVSYSSMTAQDTLIQLMTCAYDPNDKTVYPFGIGAEGYIDTNVDRLTYTIRFQNTGTDTAISVRIEDQLDMKLDWASLTPICSSHPCNIDITPEGLATFNFHEIFLPDSNANEPLSHGFIKFEIDLKPDVVPGDQIYNTAYIYFDQNPAVITNTALNTIYECENMFAGMNTSDSSCLNTFFMHTDPVVSSMYFWDVDGGVPMQNDTVEVDLNTDGNHLIHIIGTNEFCTDDTTFTLYILPELDTNYLADLYICYGDSSMLFGNYESQTGVYSQTYSSIHGCDSVVTRNMFVYPEAIGVTDTLEICAGDSTQIYGAYYSIDGYFTDTLQTVSGCDSLISTQLFVLPLPAVTIDDLNPDTLCVYDGAFTLQGGLPVGGTYSGDGVSGGDFDPSVAGSGLHTIRYTFEDISGCSSEDSLTVYVDACLGLKELNSHLVNIYPNPFDHSVRISLAHEGNILVVIEDLKGKELYRKNIATEEVIELNELAVGIYHFKIFIDGELSSIHKVVKGR